MFSGMIRFSLSDISLLERRLTFNPHSLPLNEMPNPHIVYQNSWDCLIHPCEDSQEKQTTTTTDFCRSRSSVCNLESNLNFLSNKGMIQAREDTVLSGYIPWRANINNPDAFLVLKTFYAINTFANQNRTRLKRKQLARWGFDIQFGASTIYAIIGWFLIRAQFPGNLPLCGFEYCSAISCSLVHTLYVLVRV